MLAIALAILAALGIWWVSTGAILYLNGRGPRTYARSMAGATVLLAGALYAVASLRNDASVAGAYLGFASGIAVWGWLEMSFLLGYLTGSRRQACHLNCGGLRHFLHAIQAIIWHELAIITLAGAVFVLGWQGPNRVAVWTLLILWLMRASAKLNLFLGVRNLSDELLPPHLLYLRGFFRKRPMNFLFPLSVTTATVVLTLQIRALLAPGAGDSQVISGTLLATLTALGLLEHWALVLPFSPSALWSWSWRSREARL